MIVVRPLPSALMAPWMAFSVTVSRAEVASSSSWGPIKCPEF